MLITVDEAAAVLGLKSRGSVYRKINNRELAWVDTPNGKMVEREGLEERWAAITRCRTDSPKPPGEGQERKPLRPAAERMAPRERHVPAAAPPDGTPDYNESRARAEYEKANLLELERKQKEGELLERKATLEGWANMITIAKTKFTAVPSRAKSMIPHLTVEDVQTLARLIDEALTEVCNANGC